MEVNKKGRRDSVQGDKSKDRESDELTRVH